MSTLPACETGGTLGQVEEWPGVYVVSISMNVRIRLNGQNVLRIKPNEQTCAHEP